MKRVIYYWQWLRVQFMSDLEIDFLLHALGCRVYIDKYYPNLFRVQIFQSTVTYTQQNKPEYLGKLFPNRTEAYLAVLTHNFNKGK